MFQFCPHEAIIEALCKSFDFSSRESRFDFWSFAVFDIALLVPLNLWTSDGATQWLVTGVNLVLALSATAAGVRRLHDVGVSAWWVALALVPVVGWAGLVWQWAQPGLEDGSDGSEIPPDEMKHAARATRGPGGAWLGDLW